MNTMASSSLRDFEILSDIGKGAFGFVYKVKRVKDSGIYALKKVPMMKLKSKEKENSLNEIRILASISHQNVISYKEAFYDNISNSICIVMEFAEKGDLEKKINNCVKRKSFISESEVVLIFVQIIQGLKALHDKKIIHRDIKAANIFIFEGDLVKIGDLNVSKVIKMGMLHTQTGTPYYASPEVWNDKPYDYKSDIWSLGCLLYEMTTLKAPFRGTTMKAVYEKVIKGVYDPIPNFYSKTLAGIIKVMLQINPISRPSCDQLLNLIQDKMKNLKLTADIPSVNNPNTGNYQSSALENSQSHKTLQQPKPSNEKLLRTIKIPKRMNELNSVLPKSKYKKRVISAINPSVLTVNQINKTEIYTSEHDKSNNISDISAVYEKENNKLLAELLNDSEYTPVPNPLQAKYKSENDKSENINENGKIDDDPVLKEINKPILIKKNMIKNIKNICKLNYSNNNDSTQLETENNPNSIQPQKKILNLKNNYQYPSNSNKIITIDDLIGKYKMASIGREEVKEADKLNISDITPPVIGKSVRPLSVINNYNMNSQHSRNNSSNIRRIFNQEPTYSPKIVKVEYSLNTPNNIDNSFIQDLSVLPKINQSEIKSEVKSENKGNINHFNQMNNIVSNLNSNINRNAIRLLNSPGKNKTPNKIGRSNLYPVKMEKDSYNFDLRNGNGNGNGKGMNNSKLLDLSLKPANRLNQKVISHGTPNKVVINREKVIQRDFK